ncbi:MAG: hypothetical protein PHU23_14100 [Dehalococcoidales bacterium]|nr:hypothetical protein [Dehalococcoidales bacterium]
MSGAISGVARQMAELVILASCAYMAKPAAKKVVPAVQQPVEPPANTALTQMFPPERIASIKRKALRGYKARQDAQWQRWLDSVSQ